MWNLIYTLTYVSFSGFIMSMIYFVFNYIYTEIRKRLTCSITINSSDNVYRLVLDYLKEKNYLQGSMT